MKRSDNLYKKIAGLALATGLLLLIPMIAMQFDNGVNWTLSDFIFAGALIFGTGLTYFLVTSKAATMVYRFAVGAALASVFLLVWIEGAVGVIGAPGGTYGSMELGVLAIGIIGAGIARFRPPGMAWTLSSMAIAQGLIAIIWLIDVMNEAANITVNDLLFGGLGPSGFFIVLFVGSALLFWNVVQQQSAAGASREVEQ